METCPSGQGPVITSDLVGVGVRVAVYVHAFFLPVLCCRSISPDEVTNALYSTCALAFGLTITAFPLGFQTQPLITLQDAIIVIALVGILWISVVFSFVPYYRFWYQEVELLYVYIVLTALISAFGIAVFASAHTFGATPECNSKAVIALFRPIGVLDGDRGRILGLVSISVVLVAAVLMLVYDFNPKTKSGTPTRRSIESRKKLTEPIEMKHATVLPTTLESTGCGDTVAIDALSEIGMMLQDFVIFAFVIITFAFAIVNTELMVKWNMMRTGSSHWQLGQILPLMYTGIMVYRVAQNMTRRSFVPYVDRLKYKQKMFRRKRMFML